MRRLVSVLAVFIFGLGCSDAQTQVGMSPEGPVLRVQIDFNKFASAFSPQRQSEWCWAACISNIFNYYGHPVAQERIVKQIYGAAVNAPAVTAQIIAQSVNRPWVDDNGVPFRATLTAAYDARAGVFAINNAFMIQELLAGRPILVCNASHCMVNTLIDYSPRRVMAVGVFDPWPGAQPHDLSPAEMLPANQGGQLTFLGTLIVR
jgi:hypothetical protein